MTISTFTYRFSSRDYAVYPQTNNSRFLAHQIELYSFVILTPLLIMLVYLIQYGVLALIASGRDNVHLVFDFNIGFVLSGLVLATIYFALITGAIILISALIRKFRLYAIVFFTALAIILFGNFSIPFLPLFRLLGFLLRESNIWLFILKGTITWIGLFAVAFVVNKYTVYYKAHNFNYSKRVIAGICAVMILAAFAVINLIGLTAPAILMDSDEWDVSRNQRLNALEIDLSDLPEGSNINVVASGDAVFFDGINPEIIGQSHTLSEQTLHFSDGSEQTFPAGHLIIIGYHDLFDIDGGTLFVQYNYPLEVIPNAGDISHWINPQFDIHFEGNTLYVHYTYNKNVKAIIIPIWSFMRQFESFRGQNVFNESPQLGWGRWNHVGLWLWVE